jgi:predicted ATP-grasp superfamily ATP-dependent carboligase
VVLQIAYSGYGIVRSLAPFGIPILAFQKDLSVPEAKSGLCQAIETFQNDEELLSKLISFSEQQAQKPVLYITSDDCIELFVANREKLEKNFLIHYPDSKVIELLLSKQKFTRYAIRNNLKIPKSFIINNTDELNHHIDQMIFPSIVKPDLKRQAWVNAKLKKAYLINNKTELVALYNKIKGIEPHIIVQEMIPGPDSNIEFCLTYFDEMSNCLCSFTGAKIRQWAVGTGSTASAKMTANQDIAAQTLELFNKLQYRGFGSVEYKKHSVTGEYYIMEPTVGRPDQQSYISTANGINMAVIAYMSLTGLQLPYKKRLVHPPVVYIDEWADFASTLAHMKKKELTFKQYLRSIAGKKSFRYFNKHDIKVFLFFFLKTCRLILRAILKRIKSYCFSARI